MKNKAEDLLNKVAILRADMLEYVKKYVLTGLKETNLQEYNINFAWYNEDVEPTSIVQMHSIDEDGDLFVIFEYDGKKQAEQVDAELLSFEALGALICFYDDYVE